MREDWMEMRLLVPAAGIDLVCNELSELGCQGMTVAEQRLDTFVPPDPDEPLEGEITLRAYFLRPADPEALRQAVRQRLEWLVPLVAGLVPQLPEVVPVAARNWAEDWKQHFPPFQVGARLIVKPTWEDLVPSPGQCVLNLDPGMAFGTGTHATTRLCLEALAELFEGAPRPQRVLDVGTGSGILAIAAALLGAGEVLACDIDPGACRVARENAGRNGVAAAVTVSEAPLADLPAGFEVVLANILAEENIRLADDLVRRLAAPGTLILSGILIEKEAAVIEAFRAYPLTGPEVRHRDEWSCLVYRFDL